MPAKPRLLIVEDDPVARKNLQHILESGGEHQVVAAAGGSEALELLARQHFELVLTDLRMEKVDGMQVLAAVKKDYPETEVIMLTAFASVDSAIEAMKRGAFHYIAKPYKIGEVRAQVAQALEKVGLRRELKELKREAAARDGVGSIVGKHPRIQELIHTVAQIAPTDCNVLIMGETGTGKELFARALHQASFRTERRFVAFNCAAFAEQLLVSELFGHEKGSFTGATATKPGLFEAADGGTVFLDEIGDMPQAMQVKLLRVIQEQEVERLGATRSVHLDFRIIAATNRDLKAMMAQGAFRSDLYYRLNIFHLHAPPLRQISSDIPRIAYHILSRLKDGDRPVPQRITPRAMERLRAHPWPGNVRELKNALERAAAVAGPGPLDLEHLPPDMLEQAPEPAEGEPGEDLDLRRALERAEREAILAALRRSGGNRSQAARLLGIHRTGLYQRMKRLGLDWGRETV